MTPIRRARRCGQARNFKGHRCPTSQLALVLRLLVHGRSGRSLPLALLVSGHLQLPIPIGLALRLRLGLPLAACVHI